MALAESEVVIDDEPTPRDQVDVARRRPFTITHDDGTTSQLIQRAGVPYRGTAGMRRSRQRCPSNSSGHLQLDRAADSLVLVESVEIAA